MQAIKRPESSQPIPPHAKRVFEGKIFSIWQWEQKQFDGSVKIFEKAKRPDTVNILPVTADGKIVLTEQEQPGWEPFIGCPGGIIDEGEDPLTAAKRELLEETGYQAQEFILWDAIHLVSKVDWVIYTFVAKGCTKIGDLMLDSGEKIKLKLVTFDEFSELVYDECYRDIEVALKVMKAKAKKASFDELKRLLS